MRISRQISSSHGVLFICQDDGSENVPEDTSASLVTYTDNCIAFWVIPEVDGKLDIGVIQKEEDTKLGKIFSGQLKLLKNFFSVSQPDGSIIFSICSKNLEPKISIYSSGDRMDEIDILIC